MVQLKLESSSQADACNAAIHQTSVKASGYGVTKVNLEVGRVLDKGGNVFTSSQYRIV